MKVSYLNDAFFSRLETLALNLRTDLSGYFGGKHLVKTYGQTVEFADYREYQLGDDIRRIDWNLYSRFEKYFLKLFTDERQMQIQIFLDCSASMGKENPKKAAYAIATAAALGFLSVHNMDKVSYKLMRENRSEDPFGTIVGKTLFSAQSASWKTRSFPRRPISKPRSRAVPISATATGLRLLFPISLPTAIGKKRLIISAIFISRSC